MIELLIYSAVAGAVGTGLGGLIGIIFGQKSESIANAVLSFAGGAMLGMVFFSIIPEAMELANPMIVLLGSVLGVLLIYILNYAINYKFKDKGQALNIRVCFANLKPNKNKHMLKTGLIMFLAIAIHNIPEGMAIGSVGTVEKSAGLTIAILLLIHNIPEGMAITLPLSFGGYNKFKAVLISVLAGSVTLLGGLIGIFLGNINAIMTATTLGFAGGAMLNVTFMDIIPETIRSNQNKQPMLYLMLGLAVIYILVQYV